MIRWIFVTLVLLGLSSVLAVKGWSQNLDVFKPSLIAVNITVAVIAINFALSAYQGSEYRQFQRGLSPNLLMGCLFVLAGAMSPAICTVFAPTASGIVGISMLPITALLSVALVGLAKREATPQALIHLLNRRGKWLEAFRLYGGKCREAEARWKKWAFTPPQNMPTHEWAWQPLPPLLPMDPIALLGAIGCTAAKGGNASSLVQTTTILLRALDDCHAEIRRSKLPSEVTTIVKTQLDKIALAAESSDPTGDLSQRFLDACAEYLGHKSEAASPLASPCLFVANMMVNSGIRWIGKGRSPIALPPLVVIRLLCEKGISSLAKRPSGANRDDDEMESLFWYWNISTLAAMMKPLGTASVQSGDSNFLYRAFDAYGWLGCSAVKANEFDLAGVCVRALAQLGREARAKKMECHWDSCAVRPDDHAGERILWIVSWVVKADEATQERFLGICSQGISRLHGRVTKFHIRCEGGQHKIVTEESEDSHIEGFSSEAGERSLDYSDHEMLKDFELHGFMGGTVVHGPTIPLQVCVEK